jgi:hypothetical protein
MFFDKALRDLDEAAVVSLISCGAEEGLTLEFKAQLNLASKDEKREAAKDVSAFANQAGGRIVYGMKEGTVEDGRAVASEITPLTNGAVGQQLADVLVNAIHPRPSFAVAHVPVAGGVVLVVEVYRSDTDVHMVTGYGENRFYRRGAKGNVLLTEPEVREAYAKVGITRASVEDRLRSVIDPELASRSQIDESIVVAPWNTSPNFFDPRSLPNLEFQDLVSQALRGTDLWEYGQRMTLGGDGYRAIIGEDGQIPTAPLYLAVLKTGVVHFSWNEALKWKDDKKDEMIYWAAPAIIRTVEALRVAEALYSTLGYYGRSRLRYVLRPAAPWRINPDGIFPPEAVEAKIFDAVPRDFLFPELGGRYSSILRDVFDDLFQIRGVSPYFNADGTVSEYGAKRIANKVVMTHLG